MFTGIIAGLGKISGITPHDQDRRITVRCPMSPQWDWSDVHLGDSIAVNGVCLTVVDLGSDYFSADISVESLRLTTFEHANTGLKVNLEKALQLQQRLGGHLVSGHVDGVGTLLQRYAEGRSQVFVFSVPQSLCRYIAVKGSICVHGVSLTVNQLQNEQFSVNLVPHTLAHTNLGELQPGHRVNLEVDMIARYLERLIQGASVTPQTPGITLAMLNEKGFNS